MQGLQKGLANLLIRQNFLTRDANRLFHSPPIAGLEAHQRCVGMSRPSWLQTVRSWHLRCRCHGQDAPGPGRRQRQGPTRPRQTIQSPRNSVPPRNRQRPGNRWPMTRRCGPAGDQTHRYQADPHRQLSAHEHWQTNQREAPPGGWMAHRVMDDERSAIVTDFQISEGSISRSESLFM